MTSEFGDDSNVRRGTARYAKNAYAAQLSKLNNSFVPRDGYSIEAVNIGLLAASTTYASSLESIKAGIGVYALTIGTSMAALVNNQVNVVDDNDGLVTIPADEFFQTIAAAMKIDFTLFYLRRFFANTELQSPIFSMRSIASSMPQVTPAIINGNLVAIYGVEVNRMIKAAVAIRTEALEDNGSKDNGHSDSYVI